jgi:hypothetical protein
MTAEGPRPYQVVLVGLVRDQLRELFRAAALMRALTWVPETVAEAVVDMPPLGRVQVGSIRSIQLRIAVNDDRRLVFASWFRLLPAESG